MRSKIKEYLYRKNKECTNPTNSLDRIVVSPALLASNTNIPLFIVTGLDQDNSTNEADYIDQCESEKRSVQLAQVAVCKG